MVVDFNGGLLIPVGDVGDFAVVACDQFSAQPEYWQTLEKQMPVDSALGLILPECFLSESEKRITKIKLAAERMLRGRRFTEYNGAVYVTRTTKYGRTRRGIVASVALDDYDYKPGNKALIRASERTVEDRIPPRVVIREAIDIELPHIMLLVDDPDFLLTGACENAERKTVYDGDLRGGGGHIKGELITDTAPLYKAVDAIIARGEEVFGSRLFALVGDGNHSLATAKRCVKPDNAASERALVEIVNIYDEGLVCEPIHRLVKTDSPDILTEELKTVGGKGKAGLVTPSGELGIAVPEDKVEAINAVDALCERFVGRYGGYIEYVHGTDALCREGCVGIRLDGMKKSELFGYVVKNGVLPKKTFSLGEAEEKRYYVEARYIK